MCYSALVKKQIDHLETKYGAVAVRRQVDDYTHAHDADPKRFPKLSSRIYPGHYTPIIHLADNSQVIEIMRYGAYPPASVTNPNAYTTFNARRDNLASPFWSQAFMKHHGVVILEGFYEWVAVSDLLKAGVVKLPEIKTEFDRQRDARKESIKAAGKPYKSTATELKDARFRKIIIEFKPEDGAELIVPVIFSASPMPEFPGERHDLGFAIVTDDPPFEIEQAGHDRCPVILDAATSKEWLAPERADPKSMIDLLSQKKRITFKHKLAVAA